MLLFPTLCVKMFVNHWMVPVYVEVLLPFVCSSLFTHITVLTVTGLQKCRLQIMNQLSQHLLTPFNNATMFCSTINWLVDKKSPVSDHNLCWMYCLSMSNMDDGWRQGAEMKNMSECSFYKMIIYQNQSSKWQEGVSDDLKLPIIYYWMWCWDEEEGIRPVQHILFSATLENIGTQRLP